MASRTRVRIDPRRCDRCGRCLSACSRNAIRIGRTFIAIDPLVCDGCMACVKVCGAGALSAPASPAVRSSRAPARPVAAPRGRSAPPAAATPRARSSAQRVRAADDGWSLLEALAMLAVTLAAFVGKEALLASRPVRALPMDALVLVRAVALSAYYLVQLGAVRWLAARRGRTLRDLFGGRDRTLRERAATAGLAVLVLVGARLAAIAYGLAVRSAGLAPDSSTLLQTFGAGATGLVLAAALVVFVGPVVEELVFREVLLKGMLSRFGVPAAIAVQALIFAALHRSLWLFVPMAVLGAALGWLAHDRGGLKPAIAVHAAYNAITVVAAFTLRG
ncbi:CPBP family glutamic-type intramembrane protease [Coriobacteriia bacterium Es71-Z0120]|uniref:CPBP family glutamic-type intramembrane protease n=1 Tax=Parvivirga hydrogeniphila TaxID=2939460 RepID=UPI002260B56D|nr:CPBP family glutamic-type intramembrane protease [Parvivirga hydrogeniphila]MCL4078641.1 CPBP family glutamic-type intramembrane protease [Parvivirga hydrogeniphila]